MGINERSRRRLQLLAVLLSLAMLDVKAREFVMVPTFGEQMHEIVQAHDRGEITYEEMMVLRDTLSKQHAGGSSGSKQAEEILRKFSIAIKKPVAETPMATSQTERTSSPGTSLPDEEPTRLKPAGVTATPRKPVLNCSGIRKFMLRCLRRPYLSETND